MRSHGSLALSVDGPRASDPVRSVSLEREDPIIGGLQVTSSTQHLAAEAGEGGKFNQALCSHGSLLLARFSQHFAFVLAMRLLDWAFSAMTPVLQITPMRLKPPLSPQLAHHPL